MCCASWEAAISEACSSCGRAPTAAAGHEEGTQAHPAWMSDVGSSVHDSEHSGSLQTRQALSQVLEIPQRKESQARSP